MIRFLIPAELRLYQGPEGEAEVTDAGFIWAVHHAFHRGFEKMREAYTGILTSTLAHRKLVLICFVAVTAACGLLYPLIGTDFFPQVDAGQIRLHVRCAGGTRIEETEQAFAGVEASIRKIIPAAEFGRHSRQYRSALQRLQPGVQRYRDAGAGRWRNSGLAQAGRRPQSTWDYIREMRRRLPREFPDLTFFFQPADMVGQILNFGLPAPIDVQVVGPLRNLEKEPRDRGGDFEAHLDDSRLGRCACSPGE